MRYEMTKFADGMIQIADLDEPKRKWLRPVFDRDSAHVFKSMTEAAYSTGQAVGTVAGQAKRGDGRWRLATEFEIIAAFGPPAASDDNTAGAVKPTVAMYAVDRKSQVWTMLPGHEQWNASANTAEELEAQGAKRSWPPWAKPKPKRRTKKPEPEVAVVGSGPVPFVCATWPDGAVTVRLAAGGDWSMTRPSAADLPPEIAVAMKTMQ